MLVAKPKFGSRKEPINNQMMARHTVIDEFARAARADHEQGRHFALGDGVGELDKDLTAIIEDT